MCKDCLKEICPNRGSSCLETGSYLMNYAGCIQCKSYDIIIVDKLTETEQDNEIITYKHVCEGCGHLIASHEYTFTVDEEYQDYTMNCTLCGYGDATCSILPDDPREKQLF